MESRHLETLTKYLNETEVLKLIDLEEVVNVINVPNKKWNFKRINEGLYFKKQECVLYFVNELIGRMLSNKLDLDAITYVIASRVTKLPKGPIKTDYGVASPDFKEEDWVYFNPQETFGLHTFLEYINYLTKDSSSLMNSLSKLFAIDIYSGQTDRYGQNIIFKKQKGKVLLAPAFDFERSFINLFDGNDHVYENGYNCSFFSIECDELKDYFKVIPNLETYITKLLSLSMSELLEEIEDMYKIIIPTELKDYYGAYVEENTKSLIKHM